MIQIPFIILAHERPDQLLDMVNSIEKFTDPATYRMIICDNASTHPRMNETFSILESKGIEVIRNPKNEIFLGFNSGLQKIGNTQYFIMSDPDILIREGIPGDWICLLAKFLDVHTSESKVGLALDCERIPRSQIPAYESCYKWEKSLYNHPIKSTVFPDPVYRAMTDTTLCMYRRDTFDYWNPNQIPQIQIFDHRKIISQNRYNKKYNPIPIRVGGRFTAIHTGWEMSINYRSDYEQYINKIENGNTDKFIPSTAIFLKDQKA